MYYFMQSVCVTILLTTTSEKSINSKSKTTPDIQEFIDRLLTSDKFEQVADKIAQRAADKIVSLQSETHKRNTNVTLQDTYIGKEEYILSEENKKNRHDRGEPKKTRKHSKKETKKQSKVKNRRHPRKKKHKSSTKVTQALESSETKSSKKKKKTTKSPVEPHTETKEKKKSKHKIHSLDAIHKLNEAPPLDFSLNFKYFTLSSYTTMTINQEVWDGKTERDSKRNKEVVVLKKEQIKEMEKALIEKNEPTTSTTTEPNTEYAQSELSTEYIISTTKRKKKPKIVEKNNSTQEKFKTSVLPFAEEKPRKKKNKQKKNKTKHAVETTTPLIIDSVIVKSIVDTTSESDSDRNSSSNENTPPTILLSDQHKTQTKETNTTTAKETKYKKDIVNKVTITEVTGDTHTKDTNKPQEFSEGNDSCTSSSSEKSVEDNTDPIAYLELTDTKKYQRITDSKNVEKPKSKEKRNNEASTNIIQNNTELEKTDLKIEKLDIKRMVREHNGKFYAFSRDTDYEDYQNKLKDILKSYRENKNPSKRANVNQDLLDFVD